MNGRKSGGNKKPQGEAGAETDPSELGACALPPAEDMEQTSFKVVNQELGAVRHLSHPRSHDNEGPAHNLGHQPHSVIGCITGHTARVVPLRDPAQPDISLHEGFLGDGREPRPPASAPFSPLNNQLNATSQLGMNIPPSLEEQRIDNRSVAEGIAENQYSFHTTHSFDSGPPAMPQNIIATSLSTAQKRPSPACAQSVHSGNAAENVPQTSFEGNTSSENMAVSAIPQLPAAMTNRTAQNIASNITAQNIASAVPGAGASMSHSHSRIFIDESILVRKLPRKFITFLSERLEMNGCRNWMHLVELYGWNYEETQLFAHRRHVDGPFSSLLAEANFQNYTLADLKLDLSMIPRFDILRDLNERIGQHNMEHPL